MDVLGYILRIITQQDHKDLPPRPLRLCHPYLTPLSEPIEVPSGKLHNPGMYRPPSFAQEVRGVAVCNLTAICF